MPELTAGHPAGFDRLYLPGDTAVHRLPAAPKLLALVGFLLVVVSTGPAWAAFAGYAVLLLGVLTVARLPLTTVARRMAIETPFVVFALVLPFVATGPRTQLGPVTVSEPGLQGAALLLAKVTLGVLAAVILASTTPTQQLLTGLQTLRLPHQLVAIAGFMARYASVVTADLRRMRVARQSRAFDGGHLAHARLEARGVGHLFVRSYERGERVHQAMLARGYQGRMPTFGTTPATGPQWTLAAALPAAALLCRVLS